MKEEIDQYEYFCKTKIPCPPVRWREAWKFDPADPADPKPRWKISPHLLVWQKEIKDLFEKIDMQVETARIFRWRANDFFPWHIDGDPNLPVFFAINWVLEGSGFIQWNKKFVLGPHGNQGAYSYARGQLDDDVEVTSNGNSCLVNTYIPHRVVNLNPIHRVTLSITFNWKDDYSTAFEKLKSVNLLELK